MASNSVPYENASSGAAARDEISRILKRFGCSSVGFMDDYEKKEILLAFTHRGRNIQLRASARGWATMFLRENPWNSRRRQTRTRYEEGALDQGLIAVNSILRDWVKGQVTAVECGILSFNAVFMPYMLDAQGRQLVEVAEERGLLPPPAKEEVE